MYIRLKTSNGNYKCCITDLNKSLNTKITIKKKLNRNIFYKN